MSEKPTNSNLPDCPPPVVPSLPDGSQLNNPGGVTPAPPPAETK